MKLLIVEDNSSLAEITAQLLRSLDRPLQQLEAITLAEDLQTAILCLPEHDAVLCDGSFPLSPGSRFVVEEWDVIRQEANRRGIHFVLYSGSVHALDCARESNTPAIAKPATIEEIYATLTDLWPPAHNNKGYDESSLMPGDHKLAGGAHVHNL
jgi:CheY-like chemotaxis protein